MEFKYVVRSRQNGLIALLQSTEEAHSVVKHWLPNITEGFDEFIDVYEVLPVREHNLSYMGGVKIDDFFVDHKSSVDSEVLKKISTHLVSLLGSRQEMVSQQGIRHELKFVDTDKVRGFITDIGKGLGKGFIDMMESFHLTGEYVVSLPCQKIISDPRSVLPHSSEVALLRYDIEGSFVGLDNLASKGVDKLLRHLNKNR